MKFLSERLRRPNVLLHVMWVPCLFGLGNEPLVAKSVERSSVDIDVSSAHRATSSFVRETNKTKTHPDLRVHNLSVGLTHFFVCTSVETIAHNASARKSNARETLAALAREQPESTRRLLRYLKPSGVFRILFLDKTDLGFNRDQVDGLVEDLWDKTKKENLVETRARLISWIEGAVPESKTIIQTHVRERKEHVIKLIKNGEEFSEEDKKALLVDIEGYKVERVADEIGRSASKTADLLTVKRRVLADKLLADDREWVQSISPDEMLKLLANNVKLYGSRRVRSKLWAEGRIITDIAPPVSAEIQSWEALRAYGHEWFGFLRECEFHGDLEGNPTLAASLLEIENGFSEIELHPTDSARRDALVQRLREGYLSLHQHLLRLAIRRLTSSVQELARSSVDESATYNYVRALVEKYVRSPTDLDKLHAAYQAAFTLNNQIRFEHRATFGSRRAFGSRE